MNNLNLILLIVFFSLAVFTFSLFYFDPKGSAKKSAKE